MNRLSIVVATGFGVLGVASSASAERIYGMTTANAGGNAPGVGLIYFDSATPGSRTTIGDFTGVVAGHGLRSIDFRPANGQLYAISTSTVAGSHNLAQLYTVNLDTAALTPVGAGFVLGDNNSQIVDIDFNPVVDRIRITTGASGNSTPGNPINNNFRAHPDTGALVATDTPINWNAGNDLAGQPFRVVATAYSNNVSGATDTTLYGYERFNDVLITIGGVNGTPSPNGGELFTANADPSTTFNDGVGMDISSLTGTLYITHDNNGVNYGLYTRPLSGGPETLVGFYGGGFIPSISVMIPEPGTAVAACGAVMLMGLRRRR